MNLFNFCIVFHLRDCLDAIKADLDSRKISLNTFLYYSDLEKQQNHPQDIIGGYIGYTNAYAHCLRMKFIEKVYNRKFSLINFIYKDRCQVLVKEHLTSLDLWLENERAKAHALAVKELNIQEYH